MAAKAKQQDNPGQYVINQVHGGCDARRPHNSWICADNKKPRQREAWGFSFVQRRYVG
jgi:hypothetical protein